MSFDIHEDIQNKLDFYIKNKQIPNIIFYGPNGSGKISIVKKFISKIFDNKKELFKSYLMYVNCAHGKGIKFVREELKFFAKTHINIENDNYFKVVIMTNADYLTIDAQSALRRCIELFSHTTRFFFIVEDKYKLLKPILSRFSEIYIPLPTINNKKVNLHTYNIDKSYEFYKNFNKTHNRNLATYFKKIKKDITYKELFVISEEIYEKGFSCLDIVNYIKSLKIYEIKKYQLLILFNKVKNEFRFEKLLILFMLNFIFIRSDYNLENITFM
jgi:Cdc6-like AAA superfamily ATPase